MKFHLADSAGFNAITGYGPDHVVINGVRHQQSLLVGPNFGPVPWSVASFDTLGESDFDPLVAQNPELVLIGTGRRLRFPAPMLTRRLTQARIGSEAMDTAAACRTYNILMGEGRLVLAALLFDPA